MIRLSPALYMKVTYLDAGLVFWMEEGPVVGLEYNAVLKPPDGQARYPWLLALDCQPLVPESLLYNN